MSEQITQISIICHEANKYWCEVNGDTSKKHWYDAPQWERDRAIRTVSHILKNPNEHRVEEEKKSEFEQKKNKLFDAIIDALK